MTRDLERENVYALMAQQALLGNVSPGLHGAAFELVGKRMTFYFLVRERTALLDDDFDEITTEMESLILDLERGVDIDIRVDIERGARWVGKQHRMIFLRREIGFDE